MSRRRSSGVGARGGRCRARLLGAWLALAPWWAAAARAEPPEAPEPVVPGAVPAPDELGWIDAQRLAVEQSVGAVIDRFDRFFGDHQKQDVESPSTRLRFKTFTLLSRDRHAAFGGAVAASIHLPRLQERLGNARLVLLGQNAGGAQQPLAGSRPPDDEVLQGTPVGSGAADPWRGRGSLELRFDLIRRRLLVLDAGAGLSFAWPLAPFSRLRVHLRLPLGSGFVFRGTEGLFVELGDRGAGTSTDLLVERFLLNALRLRWEGHGLFAWHTRGVEWNTLVGAELKVHRRTGLQAGVGASGFGTPAPGLDACRAWIGVRQDLWRGWVFGELEPQVTWPRLPGQARQRVPGIMLRLELVIDARPAVVGAEG